MSTVPPAGWPHEQSPFHAGEISIQNRLGMGPRMDRFGRSAIRAQMPDEHRSFFAQLPFLVVGSVDTSGQLWASMLVGQPGFLYSPDPAQLLVRASPIFGDPLQENLKEGSALGLLGIELSTRRRNRLNGTVQGLNANGFSLQVAQSFGNCPQYIQVRETAFRGPASLATHGAGPKPVHRTDRLDVRAQALIGQADTFFIASSHEELSAEGNKQRSVDVSHRGGKPGFVRIDDESTLTIPDFVGNFFFNTLGNLLLEPRAGLLFVDFATGDALYLSGRIEIVWDGEEVKSFARAERLMRFALTQAIFVDGAFPLSWGAPQASPILAQTGSWEDAARTLAAGKARNAYRRFIVTGIVEESATIRSLILEPTDGGGVASYEPGQFLPIRINLPGAPTPLQRTYTLSDAPNGRSYRLSVKREQGGVVSQWLHGAAVGSELEALAPRGKFSFNMASTRPVVLVSAGVGITPMIAMLNTILVNDGRTRYPNKVFFVHGARNSHEHAFGSHVRALAAKHGSLTAHVVYSHPLEEDTLSKAYNSVGRVSMELLKSLLPLDNYDVYLCGPGGFMTALHAGLRSLNIPAAQIHTESFGPAAIAPVSLKPNVAIPSMATESDEAVEVVFQRSNVTALWRPASGTLLELAEANGLAPAFSCRSGACGTCAARRVMGDVVYAEEPLVELNPDEVLICCSSPRPGPHLPGHMHRTGITLDL